MFTKIYVFQHAFFPSFNSAVNNVQTTVEGTKLMARSLLREVIEPAVFVPEVAKQHEVFGHGVLVSARASF